MEPIVGTSKTEDLTGVQTEPENTYQDVDSEEFSELSDLEDEGDSEGGVENPALDRLAVQSGSTLSFSSYDALIHSAGAVQAMFSDEDIEDMHTYLKEAGKDSCLILVCGPDLSHHVALGMIAWIKLYVVERATPVILLLLALGTPIVRAQSSLPILNRN
jgi:hypothetical protein